MNNETECVPLLSLSLRFIPYVPSFILEKLFLGKTPLNLTEILSNYYIA